jgi:hypothetical protein
MARVPIDLVGIGQLDNLAQVHYCHAVRDMPHYSKIVGDEDEGQVVFPLDGAEEV